MDIFTNDKIVDEIVKFTHVEFDRYKMHFNMNINNVLHRCTYYIDKRKMMAINGNKKVILTNLTIEIIQLLFSNCIVLELEYDEYDTAKHTF